MFYNFVFQCFLLLVWMPAANARIRRYSMVNSSSVRYTNTLKHHLNTPRVKCVALCDDTGGCSSVNHNSITNRCELTSHIPRVQDPSEVDEPDWRVYYHDPLIRGVNAWQNSTFLNATFVNETFVNDTQGSLSAELAIDGNRTNTAVESDLPCARTNGSYSNWTMEFERVVEVSYVTIYFRNDMENNHRNSNLSLLVSATRLDSENGVGMDCATYPGPPASPALPIKVTCTTAVLGKFLKIIHNSEDYLTLCEVEVYSV
ncbi:uncharacterized protein LOC123541143 [Mercenaria mercenaria]|uniref:uncharacterized protein LOC123541143 n=1 Tax=Mercenaria mercenaria TaxID=6596 RepID=UPI00234E59DC|nr:uncharacterized protein LOC123541143 [Mercenaria mercenaria]